MFNCLNMHMVWNRKWQFLSSKCRSCADKLNWYSFFIDVFFSSLDATFKTNIIPICHSIHLLINATDVRTHNCLLFISLFFFCIFLFHLFIYMQMNKQINYVFLLGNSKRNEKLQNENKKFNSITLYSLWFGLLCFCLRVKMRFFINV